MFKKNPLFRSFADFSELSNDFSMAHFTFPHDDPLFLNGDRTRALKKREKEREKLFFGGQGKRGAEKPIQALRPNGPTDRLEASRDPFLFSSFLVELHHHHRQKPLPSSRTNQPTGNFHKWDLKKKRILHIAVIFYLSSSIFFICYFCRALLRLRQQHTRKCADQIPFLFFLLL